MDHGSSTRLEYELDIPKEPSDVQKEFAIRVKSDYGIIIKVSFRALYLKHIEPVQHV